MKEGVEGNEVGARAEGKPSRKARRYMYTRDKGKSGRKMESEGKLVGSVKMQRVSSERTRERDGKIKTRAYRAGAETPQSRKVPPSSAHTPASEHRYRVYSICMYTGRAARPLRVAGLRKRDGRRCHVREQCIGETPL